MKTLATAAALALATLAAPLATPALALDGKTIVAAECFGRAGTVANARGAISNESLIAPVTVRCSLPRDNPAARMTKVEISVTDNTSALLDLNDDDFFCNVSVVDRFGRTASNGAIRKTVGTNSAGTVLVLPIPTSNPTKGNYVVNCKIPRKGALDPASSFGSIYYQEVHQE